jgi:hypothetical protein
VAVLKSRNQRSAGLLRKLGFDPARAAKGAAFGAGADERNMVKSALAHRGRSSSVHRAPAQGRRASSSAPPSAPRPTN